MVSKVQEMPYSLCTLRTVESEEEPPKESGGLLEGRGVAGCTRDPEGNLLASIVAWLSDMPSVGINICPGGQ